MPGLNCYSCPAAAASCPIGAIQAVIGSSKFHFAYYVVGFLLFIGVLLGRVVCGFLCPFGWFQAVSYTHLDVYKRQGHDRPRQGNVIQLCAASFED